MCGISGKLYFDPAHGVDPDLLCRMNAALCHRGPDDAAIWTGGPVGLGQQRLAIIDLSPTGRQPMSNEDGTVWITYNGEIYNHSQLRIDLERKGHRYRGSSDTETILHLYEEHGRECVRFLRGMFAFALWDDRRRRLLLARDRFGKKPLLYAQTRDSLVFASEIKALLQDRQVPLDLDETAIHHYLTYGYVPSPNTAFRSIRKLPPASTLVWENGRVSIETYWTLSFEPKLDITEAEAAEQVLERLREATRLRLMSDVPLGAFLSGGIDSSAIVALMAEAQSGPVKTFSIGFPDRSFNELGYARLVAQRYATEHNEFTVTPDAVSVLPELVWAFGEPFADSSALPMYYLARLTRQHVTVALNGDGGDEMFAGYDRYLAVRLAERFESLPGWLREELVRPLVERLPENASGRDPFSRLRRFWLALDVPPQRRYARWITLFGDTEKVALYTPEFRQRVASLDSLNLMYAAYAWAGALDSVERTQFVDIHTYLPDDLLVKADISTMLHALEGRSPFLDHEFAEFVARLPGDYKLRGRTSKYILRRALRDHLPASILHRDKQGFGAPLGIWFHNELRPVAETVLLSPEALQRGLLSGPAVHALLREHTSGRANHGYRLWSLLCLELWFRTYLDRPRAELSGPAAGILA